MGKRQRTPHFITGIGDGQAADDHSNNNNNNNNRVVNTNTKKALHLTGLRHPKVTAPADTDDIFHVTGHTRRNNNNNNNRYPRLRSSKVVTNERLARMDLDDGRESRWDLMFTSPSGDGKSGRRGPDPAGRGSRGMDNLLLRPTEQWQISAIALVCMIVFLSALFLHMVSSDTASSNHNDHHSKSHRRIPRRRDNKRKVSLGTRKKDERYWSSDEYEEGSEVDNNKNNVKAADSGVLIPRGVIAVDSDGGQASTAALTPNNNPNSGSNKNVLHYPYQPRHRKPSVTGHKETFATGGTASSYSPSAAKTRNYYHLNPMDGPVVPSYQSPVPASKARLQVGGSTATAAPVAPAAASPSHSALAYPGTPSQQQSAYPGGTPKARTSNASSAAAAAAATIMSPGRSPAAARTTLDNTNEFIAAGLESFHPNPPVNHPNDFVGTTTPQVQRKPHQLLFATPGGNAHDTDEESQKQHSATSSPHVAHLHSPAVMNSPTAASSHTSSIHRQSGYHNGTAYGQAMSFEALSGNNINITDSSNPSQLPSLQNQQPQHFSSQYSGGPPGSNSLGFAMLSPRVDSNVSDLEETPRAGLNRRTVAMGDHHTFATNPSSFMTKEQQDAYQVFSSATQRKPHQGYQQYQSPAAGSSSSRDDPFQALRLPVVPTMASTAQGRGVDGTFSVPYQPAGQQQQVNMPFIPKLDLAGAAAMASSQQVMSSGTAGTGPPRSMSVEELHLVQMESGTHWQVKDSGSTANNIDVVTELPSGSETSKSRRKSTTNPFHASAGLGNSGDMWSVASTSADEAEDSGAADGPRNSIVHKRENMTVGTNAASSLRSSIKFDELKLDEVIGGGGFGQVWKADWRGTPVAVKVLTGSAQAKRVSKAILEEFAAEINLLSGMRHPNICLYMGACVDPPNRAIITELAANGSLWDALRLPLNPPFSSCDGVSRDDWPSELYDPGKHGFPPSSTGSNLSPVPAVGSWPWSLVKHVALGAARGMAYLHSGKPPILHRDLKSANILLSESYTAKVCDFGLSRLKAQERSMTGNCGTVQWMAVEVLAQQDYGEKADVYSYGIICIELLTRECPYDGMSAIQCALAVLNKDQRPEIPRWCPPPLRALIKSCIKKDPDERPTFSQVILALDAMP